MDLGIQGRKAVVMASSQGLGKACALALAAEGCKIVINGRDAAKLDSTREEIASKTGASVSAIVADITTETGRAKLLDACPTPYNPGHNNAGPPPGSIEDWDHAAWMSALEAKHVGAGPYDPRRPSRDARAEVRAHHHMTSAMVKAPLTMMGPSTAARAGLTALAKSVSRDLAKDNVTINNLLPERFDTDRQRFMAERIVSEEGGTFEEAKAKIAHTIAAQRLGRPEEFGAACASSAASRPAKSRARTFNSMVGAIRDSFEPGGLGRLGAAP
jgi:3-oxoacyl-[acyl-carrier protein] reductase